MPQPSSATKDSIVEILPPSHNKIIKLASSKNTINKNSKASKETEETQQLPETGDKDSNTTIWSSLLILVGSSLLFFRKRKQREK
ncbi:LPXTG cell wall anchor domain-containing protein [Staphylococcus edaphicus]|uniref:LPXTG cell wall anchor domain-containing protein n=1 Tax=Staphylococcus edaphicus TaxID=1955013 RepID=A0ABY4QB97_9STAP|nr:LPXTG cell wall anchor domain-containing protein [Staphylococcus edaphicus]UQW81226.1 LPXTG cell wall anchor domain-containing protein [Staphylococcus edaphicus]